MGFTNVQGSPAGSTGSAALTITLPANPTTGNVVCVFLAGDKSGSTVSSFTDANSNAYTKTPNSPSTFVTNAGLGWCYYLLNAPSNASKTLNVTFNQSPSSVYVGWAQEFSPTGGTAGFDKDAVANTSTTGTTINTPSITPTGSNELLFGGAAAGGTISAVGSPWTRVTGNVSNGDWAEYDLSASSATTVKFTQSSGPGWSAVAMAFTFTASGGATTHPFTTLGVGL
jgi:hypothetical protein